MPPSGGGRAVHRERGTSMNYEMKRRYQVLVRFLSGALGPDYEIVLQEVGPEHSGIIAIANGDISGRTVGSPLTGTALRFIMQRRYEQDDYALNYTGKLENGKTLRSSTMFIKDEGELAMGSDCFSLRHEFDEMLKNAIDAKKDSWRKLVKSAFNETAVTGMDDKNEIRSIEDFKSRLRSKLLDSLKGECRNGKLVYECQLNAGIVKLKESYEKGGNDKGFDLDRFYNGWSNGKMKEKIAQRDDAVQALVILEKQVLNEADLRLAIGGDENIQRASEIYHTVAYSDSTNVTKCLKYLQFLINMGRFEEAYAFADEASRRNQTDPGPISAVYQELGKIAQAQNDFGKAKRYLKASLYYAELVPDDDSIYKNFRLNFPLHMLGLTYYRSGNIDSSLYYIEQAMQCRKILLENDTVFRGEYANECNSLAVLYKQKHRYQEALVIVKEAVKMADTICKYDPSYFPCLAVFVNSLATIHQSLGQADSADYCFRQSLDIWENRTPYIMNFFKRNYADNIVSYARFNEDMNRLDEACQLYEKALAVCREGLEISREAFEPLLIKVLDELAKLSKAVGNEADEKRYREEADSYRN